jgi:phage baseplate assembly protein W
MDEIMLPQTGSTEPVSYDATFIGRGFYWPLQVDHTGSIRLTDGAADLDRSMAVILATAPGERVMRPQFGCKIWDLLFEPITANLLGLMAQAVRDALAQWEPRVEVVDVRPEPDSNDHTLIMINVSYRVKATNDRRNLVYPFYVIPHEEG